MANHSEADSASMASDSTHIIINEGSGNKEVASNRDDGLEPESLSIAKDLPIPLNTSKLANVQRTNDSSPGKTRMDKHLLRASNLDDKSHTNLRKALEKHCNIHLNDSDAKQARAGQSRPREVSVGSKDTAHQQSIGLANNGEDHPAEPGLSCGAINEADKKVLAAENEQLKQALETAKQKIALQQEALSQARSSKRPSELLSATDIYQDVPSGEHPTIDESTVGLCDVFGSTMISSGVNYGDRGPGIPGISGAFSEDALPNYFGSYLPTQSFATEFVPGAGTWCEPSGRSWRDRGSGFALSQLCPPQIQHNNTRDRGYTSSNSISSSGNVRLQDENEQPGLGGLSLRSAFQSTRESSLVSPQSRNSVWDQSSLSSTSFVTSPPQQSNLYQQTHRPPRSSLSASASEFTVGQTGPWNTMPSTNGQTYVPTTEPLNYRRLLDRNVSCNWKYIVDKIVCNNDQQASIFLQQKLKVGTVEQKYEIVEAIVAQAYPLMVNRFGNFLVQRCFEHGTPEQVVSIANAIRGNTLNLSMDAFGCHVVQKAFDAVPEDFKAIMVHELLRRIPETVIHRYACHVWQKLFELRWSDSPPQIMKYVNEALRGMWHEVALGETGSLVVQNIFENCLEEDKRPCIYEVLENIDIIAHGQFGNWCIQHICEHGATTDRNKAIDHVLHYATEYSMDQFASKVVEKCLKIGGNDFLDRYLHRVCEGRSDRPRIPLIDIASDQYGNYLIQYILTHASSQHREIVASHIKKHMVSLRGSKFGSRVGMLCSNPGYSARPGPLQGQQPSSRFNGGNAPSRFSGSFR